MSPNRRLLAFDTPTTIRTRIRRRHLPSGTVLVRWPSGDELPAVNGSRYESPKSLRQMQGHWEAVPR
jgi:hypothetical protein